MPRDSRRGWIIGVVAGATAVVLVIAGLLVWSLSGPGPAYTGLPVCDELLTSDALAEIPGAEGAEIDGEEFVGDEPSDGGYESYTDCFAAPAGSGGGEQLLYVSARLFPVSTADDGYAELQRRIDDTRRPVDEALGDATAGTGVAVEGGFTADLEVRELPVEGAGYAVSYSGADWGEGNVEGEEAWSTAEFFTRNVMVSIIYSGTPGMEPAERLDAVSDAAVLVEDSIEAAGETV
ncbi:hypothetical protein ACFOVU_03810 [Nocardiopsis sediminis]|uniref:DUF3558 domain-containing protein n=1 Tax=Nocardiopsis sediminis TaxID=1778267 RepID=A0ABV8FK60_9ACTN